MVSCSALVAVAVAVIIASSAELKLSGSAIGSALKLVAEQGNRSTLRSLLTKKSCHNAAYVKALVVLMVSIVESAR